MTRLRSTYSLLAAVVLVVVAGLLLTQQRRQVVDDIVRIVEQQNVALARSFANTIWPRYSGYVASVSGLDGETLRGRNETREIHEILETLITDIPVLKVKIFSASGLTVYSSEPAQIGEDESADPPFIKAMREGVPSTKLVWRDAFPSFAGEVYGRHIVESYLPIRMGGGPVEGVFEIYTDVTPLMAGAGDTVTIFVIVLALVFGLLIVVYVRENLSARRSHATADAAEALNARMGRILDESFNEIYILDADSLRYLQVNRGARENLGYSAEEMARLTLADIAVNFAPERFRKLMAPTRGNARRQIVTESAHRRKDGSIYHVEVRMQIFAEESPPIVVSIVQDISERRKARLERRQANEELETRVEERTAALAAANEKLTVQIAERKVVADALRASEARIQAILDNTTALVHLKDTRGRYLLVNRQIEELVGAAASDMIGKTDHELTRKDIADTRSAHDREVLESGEPMQLEETVVGSDGSTRTYLAVKFPMLDASGEVYAVGGIATDITRRKDAEEALRAAKDEAEAANRAKDTTLSELAAVLDTIDYGVVFMDAEQRGRIINKAFQDMWGIPPEFIAGNPTARELMEFNRHNGVYNVGEEGWDRYADERVAAIERGDIAPMELERADGVILQYQCTALPDGGRMLSYFDITSHKRIQGELKRARDNLELRVAERTEELRAVLDNAVVGIITIDQRGIVKSFNPAAEKVFGIAAEAVISRNVKMLMPESYAMMHDGLVADYVAGGDPKAIGRVRAVTGLRADGSTFPMELSVGVMSLHGEVHFVGNVTDISERVDKEEQLRHAQKMESLGQLTGGVAHEFNNLLTAISGFAQMTVALEEMPERGRDWLQEIVKAADQAAELTNQMLAFGRKQVLEPRVVAVKDVLGDLEAMIGPIIGDAITPEFRLPDDDPSANVDPNLLSQAVLNLAINAGHAMPDGGAIVIGCRVADLDRKFVARFPRANPGSYVGIFVSDTGAGIDDETLEHIFEPFFTTKETGEGTGLGLSMVYGMVEQSGGFIDVETELGAGTTFTIYLPLVAGTHEAADAERIAAPGRAKGGQTILVAEDKPAVRQLARAVLKDLGYTVLTAEDGEKAAEMYRDCDGAVDLLLTDVAMPNKDGPSLAKELRAADPDLKIVFMSGYSEFGRRDKVELSGLGALLPKPFDPDELGRLVQTELQGGGRKVETAAAADAGRTNSGNRRRSQ